MLENSKQNWKVILSWKAGCTKRIELDNPNGTKVSWQQTATRIGNQIGNSSHSWRVSADFERIHEFKWNNSSWNFENRVSEYFFYNLMTWTNFDCSRKQQIPKTPHAFAHFSLRKVVSDANSSRALLGTVTGKCETNISDSFISIGNNDSCFK